MTRTKERIMLTEMLNRAHYMMGFVSENKNHDEAKEAVARWHKQGLNTLVLWCSTYNDWEVFNIARDSLDDTYSFMLTKINSREA